MCGIGALVHLAKKEIPETLLRSYMDKVAHRGPDGEGYLSDTHWALGHRRLAVIDLHSRALQPMSRYRYSLVFNGEIYNYKELRKELAALGVSFTTESDTEVVLAAYATWGPQCQHRFRGMWALVLYDPDKHQLWLSRDRFGIKPIYFHFTPNYFAVASEIKQFTSLPDWHAALDHDRAWEWLYRTWQDHTAGTLFKNVHQLLPGHHAWFDLDTLQIAVEKWYELPMAYKSPGVSSDPVYQWQQLFDESLRLHLRSDVPVGTALSGGLDSSSIAVSLPFVQETPIAYHTISSCSHYPEYDERRYIHVVNRQIKAEEHLVFPDGETLLENLKNLTWIQDEPLASSSLWAQFLVMEKAHQLGLTVMLDGQGADEILAGYDIFFQPYLQSLPLHQRIKPLVQWGIQPNTPLFKYVMQWWKKRGTRSKNTGLETLLKYTFPASAPDRSTIRNLSYSMLQFQGLRSLLHFEDRNSMAHGIESRVPFLDHLLVEYTLALPDAWKFNAGTRKVILREALKKRLPPEVYHRKDKMGFVTPQQLWIKKYAHQFELALGQVEKQTHGLVQCHPSLLQTDSDLAWRCIALGTWMETFSVNPDI
jgi:asparagine synthase (glutamine-hydrolysing)